VDRSIRYFHLGDRGIHQVNLRFQGNLGRSGIRPMRHVAATGVEAIKMPFSKRLAPPNCCTNQSYALNQICHVLTEIRGGGLLKDTRRMTIHPQGESIKVHMLHALYFPKHTGKIIGRPYPVLLRRLVSIAKLHQMILQPFLCDVHCSRNFRFFLPQFSLSKF
jgi:hypothetical protein